MTTETTSGRDPSGVQEGIREVADTAQKRAGGVAQTARDEAGDVVAHTQAEARDLIQELRSSMRQQTQAQRERMAEALGGFERELQQMVDQGGGSGPATEAVRQLAQRLRSWRQYLEGEGDLADDLRSFARRRPGTFLLAAAAAGVVAGRITRGVRAGSGPDSGDGPTGGHGTPGYGMPGYAGAVGAYPPSVTPEHTATGYPGTEYAGAEQAIVTGPTTSTPGPLPTDPSAPGRTGRGGSG